MEYSKSILPDNVKFDEIERIIFKTKDGKRELTLSEWLSEQNIEIIIRGTKIDEE